MKSDNPIPAPITFYLTLADNSSLMLYARDKIAIRVLGFLARVASLSPIPLPPMSSVPGEGLSPGKVRRILVLTDKLQEAMMSEMSEFDAMWVLASPDTPIDPWIHRIRARMGGNPSDHFSDSLPDEEWFWQQLTRLSAAIGRETQSRGGMLAHSGLAVLPPSLSRNGSGVLLAGRSGVGKTTASRRLPSPWRALADDMTLIVRDSDGGYWAHPWPTWSRFFDPEKCDGSDRWNVEEAVPLHAIVVLEQAEAEDSIEALGPGHAVALLAELARQTSTHLEYQMTPEERVAFNLQRFDNLCDLVRVVPSYMLHTSLTGRFWEHIEGVLQAHPEKSQVEDCAL